MSRRGQIITLSVVACIFGGLALFGASDDRNMFYAINVVCSVAAGIFASIDLRRRDYGWGWAILAAYLAPLVGTILYAVFSGRRGYSMQANGQVLVTG